MAGAMRRMGIYLGLVEDDDPRGYGRYDSRQPDHAEYDRRYGRYAEDQYDGDYAVGATAAKLAVREPVAAVVEPVPAPAPQPYRITTLHPRTYNEARTIGERFRDGLPVIMNLTEMDDADAKRLVDFAAGLSFGLRGSIERVTAKVFLLSPQNVDVTAEDKARIREGGFFNQS
jgi:cell division inhibitor SepF